MNPERQQAIDYLRAPKAGLWSWAENGSVLVWNDGTTIGFREEVVQILEWLSPNGLPSFGAIVFLMAACKGKVPRLQELTPETPAATVASESNQALSQAIARRPLRSEIENARAQLEKVAQLPLELRSSPKGKCVLAEAVFEANSAERYVQPKPVLRGMSEPIADSDLVDPDSTAVHGTYLRQIYLLARWLALHTPESLLLRLRTGLDSLPNLPDIDLPGNTDQVSADREIKPEPSLSERARKLIEQLSRDRELGAVARAARELMAAVRLPRRLAEHDHLAVGGVSDITNRGPLDRLLLSELANDDLTLAARVALNEALYLRREPPMREPPGSLALVLDSGVRLWGVPRVLATAVGLALIARDKHHSEVLAWRAQGCGLVPVDLLTSDGLTNHLAVLDPAAHPGDVLPALSQAVESDARNQSVLITHPDTLADPEFRRALAENPGAPGFVATVDRDGHFELHAMPLARRQPACEANLDLAAIFDDGVGISLINQKITPALPAIFGVSPFPFLLPVAGRVDYWVPASKANTCALLQDGRVVHYGAALRGARVLGFGLPAGKTVWMDCVGEKVHLIKGGAGDRPARLVTFSTCGEPPRVVDLLSGKDLKAVYRYGDVILLIRSTDIRAHSLTDGRLLGRVVNHLTHIHGRFFRGNEHFHFAAWNGERICLEQVVLPQSFSTSVFALAFDRQGLEGPWFIHHGGLVISSVSGERINLPMPPKRSLGLEDVRVSRDGHAVYWVFNSLNWRRVINLVSGEVRSVDLRLERQPVLDPPPPLPAWNLYRVFESIACLPDRTGFALLGRKGRWRKLALAVNGTLRITELPPSEAAGLESTPFGSEFKVARLGCSLQLAQWPNGNRAFLDSRALLHLKSRDPTVPEVSLVLADGEVAAWNSAGHVCGPRFFFEGEPISEPVRVFEAVLPLLSS